MHRFFLGCVAVTAMLFCSQSDALEAVPEGTPYTVATGAFDTGSSFLVSQSAPETDMWKLELIRSAKQTIEISGSFGGGANFRYALDVLDKMMDENPKLKVHLMLMTTLMSKQDLKALEAVAAHHPEQFLALQTTAIAKDLLNMETTENHVKMLVVDERYFVVGGTNFEESLSVEDPTRPLRQDLNFSGTLQRGSRDLDVVGVGAMAKTLRTAYFRLFEIWEKEPSTSFWGSKKSVTIKNRYTPLDPKSQVASISKVDFNEKLVVGIRAKVIISGPEFGPLITEEYIRVIGQSTTTLTVGNLYFIPVGRLESAFLDAVNRGVHLEVFTNGVGGEAAWHTKSWGWDARFSYLPMILGKEYKLSEEKQARKARPHNTKIYEYYNHQILYHKKWLVADSHVTMVGSYNMGRKSDSGDYELAVTLESDEIAQQALQTADADKQNSNLVPFEDAYSWYFDWSSRWRAGFEDYFHGLM